SGPEAARPDLRAGRGIERGDFRAERVKLLAIGHESAGAKAVSIHPDLRTRSRIVGDQALGFGLREHRAIRNGRRAVADETVARDGFLPLQLSRARVEGVGLAETVLDEHMP